MRSLVGLILAICLVWAIPGEAEASAVIDGRRLNDLMANYYLAPDPATALGWLPKVETQALRRAESIDIVAMFYLQVLRAYPAGAHAFVDAVSAAGGPAVLTAATAVWLSGVTDREALVARLRATGRLSDTEVSRLTGFPVFETATFLPQTAHELDLCWAAYYATGDAVFIEKVARHLPYMLPKDAMVELGRSDEPGVRAIFERALVARAAAWSLVSHARRHERVMSALRTMAVGEEKYNKAVKALFDEVALPGK